MPQALASILVYSAFDGHPTPTINFIPTRIAVVKEHSVEYLDAVLQYVPETAQNKDSRAKLSSVGIGLGKSVEFKDLSAEHKAAVMLGMKAGAEKLTACQAHVPRR